jgi:hypothetical protein
MAAILPTVPVEMPDLAGQAFKLQEYRTAQKKEEQDRKEKERSSRASQSGLNKLYEQTAELGQVLNRFKPEVQKAFDDAIKLGEQYSYTGLDGDKKAYLESLGGFNTLLGGAKAKTDIYNQQVQGYYTDPSKFSITGEDFMNVTKEYADTPAGIDEIVDISQGIFRLPTSEGLKFLNPEDAANSAIGVFNNKQLDFSDGYVVNKPKASDYLRNTYLPNIVPVGTEAELMAIAYGARKQGFERMNERELSRADLERLQKLPQEQKSALKQEYLNDVMKIADAKIPNRLDIKEPKETEGEKTYSNLKPAVIDLKNVAATKDEVTGQVTSVGSEGRTIAKDVNMYNLPQDAWIVSDRYAITAFGRGRDGSTWIRTSTKAPGDVYVQEYKKASSNDVSLMKNTMGPQTYSKYFGVSSQGSDAKQKPQAGISDAELDNYILKAKGRK